MSPLLPLSVILAANPCKKQFALVARLWPDGIPLDEAGLRTALENKVDLVWAERLLSAPARAEYYRACAPACAEYCRVNDAAYAEYDRVRGANWAEYAEYERARADYFRVTDAARADYFRVTDAATLAGLLTTFGGGE